MIKEWVETAYWLPAVGTFEMYLSTPFRERIVIRRKLIEFTKTSVTGNPRDDKGL